MIRPNFRANEFYSTSAKYGYSVPDCHQYDEKLLDAAQWLRDFTGVPWKPTSTLRVLSHNRSIGSKDTSLHVYGQALDIQPVENRSSTLRLVFQDIAQKGPIYAGLRERGINGIGVYDSFIHLDTRQNFAAWDFSGRTGIPKITTDYLSCIPEPEWIGLDYGSLEGMACIPEAGDEKKKPLTWIDQIFTHDSEDGFSAYTFKISVVLTVAILMVVAGLLYWRYRK